MTREEFLNDTIRYYSEDVSRRSVMRSKHGQPMGCFYVGQTENSDGCAIGRHLSPELKEELDRSDSTSVRSQKLFNRLPIWIKKLGKDFLADIQNLHDNEHYWDKNGLTTDGLMFVEEIRRWIR